MVHDAITKTAATLAAQATTRALAPAASGTPPPSSSAASGSTPSHGSAPASDGSIASIVAQIEHCFTANESTKANAPKSSTPLSLTDILGPKPGPKEIGYWWRLYINPMDWKDALSDPHKEDPGKMYDKGKSPGWQKAMTDAYQKYLAISSPGPVPTNYQSYFELFEAVTVGVKAQDAKKGYRLQNHTDGGAYPCPSIASDCSNDMIAGKPLAMEFSRVPRGGVSPWSGWLPNHPIIHAPAIASNCPPLKDSAGKEVRPNLQDAADALFQRFQTDIGGATTRFAQLTAIARLTRGLHVIHFFTDGNGRLNVQTLLPMLLLKYGFGLPLGGANEKNLDSKALNDMFAGPYTVEQAAQFLWVAQDFGVMAQKKGEKSALFD